MRLMLAALTAGPLLGLGAVHAQSPEPVSSSPVISIAPADGEAISPDATSGPWYASADYIFWWLHEGHVPAILTTSSAASAGRLGAPDTRVIYGDDRLETRHGDQFNGARVSLGYWFDDEQTVALEVGGFALERDSTHFKAVSNGDQLLARPFFNALTDQPDSYIVAGSGPNGPLAGNFVGYSRVEFFGEQADLRASLLQGENGHLDLLAGGRFLQMRDRLDLTAVSWLLPSKSTLFAVTDQYRTHDEYYGGELGLEGEVHRGGWFLRVRGEASLGGDVQQIRTAGDRIYQTPLVRVEQPYGLTVMPSNAGTFERTRLDAVYETGVNVGYRFNSHVEGYVGYTFIYWTNPIRAGDQVDLTVNPGPIQGTSGGPARPAIPWHEDAFWAQGLNAGVEFRW